MDKNKFLSKSTKLLRKSISQEIYKESQLKIIRDKNYSMKRSLSCVLLSKYNKNKLKQNTIENNKGILEYSIVNNYDISFKSNRLENISIDSIKDNKDKLFFESEVSLVKKKISKNDEFYLKEKERSFIKNQVLSKLKDLNIFSNF